MITLCEGLKNSLIVLELLRNDEDLQEVDVYVRCFHNCREMGLTFTLWRGAKPNLTYCIYEHRNSDEIIVNHAEGWVGVGETLPYLGDKYTYDHAFPHGEYRQCADFLKTELLRVKAEKSPVHAQEPGG